MYATTLIVACIIFAQICPGESTMDAKRLYDDLMSGYNKLIRPVNNNSDILRVKLGLKLTQLIDVNLKSQIMSTNVWLTQEWNDYKLKWDPEEYGGVSQMYVPSEQIWLPDIVLYNNADGNYEIVTMTKAIIYHDGKVEWNPPAIYKSSCNIDITYFPFDYQECTMKFGTWTYDGNQVDLRHLIPDAQSRSKTVLGMNATSGEKDGDFMEIGIDLSEFYLNVEWDIMKVPARRKEIKYSCCPEVYLDITYNLTLRRKTLFYTINLIIPCVSISGLSILVFYLPSDSGEKVTLSVSILLSLIFFFLVLIEIIPSTSLVIPLLGKYLIFTMILVTVSVIVTIILLNIHFRSPSTHRMSPWVRKTFIHTLPKLLLMRPPQYKLELERKEPNKSRASSHHHQHQHPQQPQHPVVSSEGNNPLGYSLDSDTQLCYPRKIDQVIRNAIFIAHHIDNADEYKSNQDDWKYVSMVLDRLFLWIFTLACIVGTGSIFTQAPSIYDSSIPLDVQMTTLIRSQL